ncbi:pentatricopeptide repeat-containing protein At4g19191, mitochondrial [Amborella trichopoda]|uniref:pentatricopeptide repeat-containing protein At4g19191, mitochondrial n=1 Tax=Amborella trichopoda TaxID=13333 RepID=UPI0005D3CFF8|nr:pentatricopeptide repeat-containing protein At4g19191, mitochondrial [Amborella trichopoda]|eukprot:XP_011624820.1 pentatricopeptide repeat-containing protein At4g19191, mitochondrial [Amborella trichopoda]
MLFQSLSPKDLIAQKLHICANSWHLKQVHGHMITSGIHESTWLLAKAVALPTMDSGHYLNQIFERISSPPISSWNSMIRTSAMDSNGKEALLIFRQMKRTNVEPDNLTFPVVAKACGLLCNLYNGLLIHAHVLKSRFSSDIFVQTALVDMYVKCHDLHSARLLFDRMTERDTVSWNSIIGAYSKLGGLAEAFLLFQQLQLDAYCKPDSITIVSLLQSCTMDGNLQAGKCVHCMGIKAGTVLPMPAFNTLISMYARCNDIESAELLFNGMPENVRDVVTWNSMISGFCELGKFLEALMVFRQMGMAGMYPDLSTMLSLLCICSGLGLLPLGKAIHGFGLKSSLDSNISACNSLIAMYSKCKDIGSARFLFDNLPKRTVVSWGAIISGYAQNGLSSEALDLFRAMERPDEVAVVAALSACGNLGALEIGREINKYIDSSGFCSNTIVCNALLDMYAKCGDMVDAHRLFEKIPKTNVISWTTLISGYANNGACDEALRVFFDVLKSGLRPNHISFLAVLSACTHAGRLEKALELFGFMAMEHRIAPKLEHYACVTDLLGRKGLLRQALDLIEKMPMEPDVGIWGALLGACQVHGDIELGEYVAERLFKLDPSSAVSYVVLANIYAAGRQWGDVAKVRAMMKSRGAKKVAGQSFVELAGKVHSFAAEDRCHPEGVEIYKAVNSLTLQLKDAGFEQGMSWVMLHEME